MDNESVVELPHPHRHTLGNIRLLQINLNHTRKAMQSAAKHILENKIDIALLQDACVNKNSPNLFDFPSAWRTFHSKNDNAHVVIANQNLIVNHLLATEDAVFVVLSASEGDFVFVVIKSSHKTGTVSIAVECGVKMSFRVNIIQTEK